MPIILCFSGLKGKDRKPVGFTSKSIAWPPLRCPNFAASKAERRETQPFESWSSKTQGYRVYKRINSGMWCVYTCTITKENISVVAAKQGCSQLEIRNWLNGCSERTNWLGEFSAKSETTLRKGPWFWPHWKSKTARTIQNIPHHTSQTTHTKIFPNSRLLFPSTHFPVYVCFSA